MSGEEVFAYRGSSMEGTFREGDLLVVSPASPAEVRPGDVIAFRRRERDGRVSLVAHRVRRCTGGGFVTKGDQANKDDGSIPTDDLVGRVEWVWRDGRVQRVWRGRAGRLWANLVRLRHVLFRLLAVPARLLRASGLVRFLWRPDVVLVHLMGEEGRLIKYVHRGRTVAWWRPGGGHFRARFPYGLVLTPPAVPPHASHESHDIGI